MVAVTTIAVPSFIETIVNQSPVLGVLVMIVWLFLKELRAMHRDDLEARTADRQVLEKVSDTMLKLSQSNFVLASRIEALDAICPLAERERRHPRPPPPS